MSGPLLAISYAGRTLGAALYEEDECCVRILNDIQEDDDFSMLKSLIDEVKPSLILANKTQDAVYIGALRAFSNHEDFDATTYVPSEHDLTSVEVFQKPLLPNDNLNPLNSTSTASLKKTATKTITITSDELPGETVNNIEVSPTASTIVVPETPLYDDEEVIMDKRDLGLEDGECDITMYTALELPISPKGTKKPRMDDEIQEIPSVEKNRNECEIQDDENEEKLENKAPIVVTLLPSVAFNLEQAKTKMERLVADGINDSSLLTAFRFELEAKNMIRSLGALLRYLDQNRVGVEFEEITKKTPIKAIRTLILSQLVEIDSTTYKALEIFESDYNPATVKRKFVFGNNTQGMKEGLSLFKLCNLCRSVPGKRMLKSWFERPIRNLDILKQRVQAVSFFRQDHNLEIASWLRSKLRSVNSLRPLLSRMRSGTVSVADWNSLYSTGMNMIAIGQFLDDREVELDIFKDRQEYFGDNLSANTMLLNDIIDLKGSYEEGRFVVNQGIDPTLDETKEDFAKLPKTMDEYAAAEAEELNIDACSVAYMPALGYMLRVPLEAIDPRTFPIKDPPIATFEEAQFFKSERMKQLDSEVGDVKFRIIDMETEIMLNLQKVILERRGVFIRACEMCATLDCLISLALVARDRNWVRPKLVEEPIIDVDLGRHPVSEVSCHMNFVANPIKSGGKYTKIKMISGPNASGKSVYLKMVGVIAFMAHIGSFVPAESATIGAINRIISRMYTIDSVLNGMSSFANDLRQMSNAIRKCDSKSLVIIDEFGKGTMTEVGLSLLASCLNYWIEKGDKGCPHIYVSSHFHALPTLLLDTSLMSFHTMDVLKNDNELEFQYKFIEGVIDNSFASYTARKSGIPADLVDRANEVYNLLKAGCSIAKIPHQDEDDNRKREEVADRMQLVVDRFLEWDLDDDPEGFLELAKAVLIDQNEH